MGNTLTWLHLSDWHQKGTEFNRQVVLEALLKDIRERARISPELARLDFIAFTGDVAYCGRKEEYDKAIQIFFKPVLKAAGVRKNRLFIIPGNHDVDYAFVPPDRLEMLDTADEVIKWQSDERHRRALLEPMSDYAEFIREFLGDVQSFEDPAFWYKRELMVGGKRIAVVGLNSAWLSGYHREGEQVNDYGFLALGEYQVREAMDSAGNADLVIALTHHPLDWLQESDLNRTKGWLKRCHFILRGHSHQPDIEIRLGIRGEMIEIPAGACYDRRIATDPLYANSYNYVHLDFERGQGAIYLRRYSSRQDSWVLDVDSIEQGCFKFPLPQRFWQASAAQVSTFKQWLEQHGFKPDPFEHLAADRDEALPRYYVEAMEQFDSFLNSEEPCVLFAGRGCGKTAVRRRIEEKCRPHDRSPRLALVYDARDFEAALEKADGKTARLRPEHHIESLLKKGIQVLGSLAEKDRTVQKALAKPQWQRWFNAYQAIYVPQAIENGNRGDASLLRDLPVERLMQFARMAEAAGIRSCVVLVDGLDEVRVVREKPAEAVCLLKDLLGYFPVLRCPGMVFKFFLPADLKPFLERERWYRADLVHSFDVRWDVGKLTKMIDSRLSHFSRRGVEERLEYLCVEDLGRDIYGRIARLADYNPRAVITITRNLIEAQSKKPAPSSLISRQTWEEVEQKWRREHDTSAAAGKSHPVLVVDEDNRRVTLGEIEVPNLSPLEFAALACLYRHQDQVCHKNTLAREAWSLSGGIDQTIAATTKRLRDKLYAYAPNVEYIVTVHGEGYRLYPNGAPQKRLKKRTRKTPRKQ